jgi:hypothetical protein
MCPWSHSREVEGPSVSDIKANDLTRSSMVSSAKVTQHQDLSPGFSAPEQKLCVFRHNCLTLHREAARPPRGR